MVVKDLHVHSQKGVLDMNRCCAWCSKIVETTIARPTVVFCTKGCRAANTLFEEMFSDEEINRRVHYHKLTGGHHEGEST